MQLQSIASRIPQLRLAPTPKVEIWMSTTSEAVEIEMTVKRVVI
jgi:hypothetical protein